MIELQIKEELKKQKKSKYWFIKKMEGSYQSLSKMMNNETKGIKFNTLDKICDVLDCEIQDIVVRRKDSKDE